VNLGKFGGRVLNYVAVVALRVVGRFVGTILTK
jgi:hypothetical protein